MTAQVTAPQTHAPIPDLDPLKVEPMVGDDLDSFGTLGKFRALIPTAKLLPSDKFYVEITGEPDTPKEGNYKSQTFPLGAADPRSLNLDNKTVAFHLGKKMTVTYTIIRSGEEDKPSPPRVLNVRPLPKSELKAARIREAQNDGNGPGLDLTGSTVDLTLRLDVWPLIAKEQRCWIDLEGKKAGDVAHRLPVLQSESVDGAWITRGYREVRVPRSYFAELSDGSELKLIVKVALNQMDDDAQAFDFEERVYTVKNVAVIKPVITRVTDSKDVLVADNGETTDTTLKLEGTAGVGETVEIFIGADSDETVLAVDGTWKYELIRLSQATHVIKVVTRGQSSNTWTVTVKALVVKPTIGEVKDSAGTTITNPGTTTSTPLKLTGRVASGEKVKIYNGATLLGEGKSTGPTTWEFDTSLLSPTEYVFKAIGQHDDLPVSGAWTVTVKEGTVAITEVRDILGQDVPNFSTITASAVTLFGRATAGRTLHIFDNGESIKTELVKSDGTWICGLANLSNSTHEITAVWPGSGYSSNVWRFTVAKS